MSPVLQVTRAPARVSCNFEAKPRLCPIITVSGCSASTLLIQPGPTDRPPKPLSIAIPDQSSFTTRSSHVVKNSTTAPEKFSLRTRAVSSQTVGNPPLPSLTQANFLACVAAVGVGVAPGSVFLTCEAKIASSTQVTSSNAGGPWIFVQSAYSGPSFNIASPQELNVIWNWSAASAVNAVYIQSATITMGH